MIKALEWFLIHRPTPQALTWHWNPRATGTKDEPDLRGTFGEEICVSAEVTTSGNPQGVIDSRMAKTLAKLSAMRGSRFYFVVSSLMARRARTKVTKSGYNIVVVDLSEGLNKHASELRASMGSMSEIAILSKNDPAQLI